MQSFSYSYDIPKREPVPWTVTGEARDMGERIDQKLNVQTISKFGPRSLARLARRYCGLDGRLAREKANPLITRPWAC